MYWLYFFLRWCYRTKKCSRWGNVGGHGSKLYREKTLPFFTWYQFAHHLLPIEVGARAHPWSLPRKTEWWSPYNGHCQHEAKTKQKWFCAKKKNTQTQIHSKQNKITRTLQGTTGLTYATNEIRVERVSGKSPKHKFMPANNSQMGWSVGVKTRESMGW